MKRELKKIVSILLVTTMLVILTACESSTSTPQLTTEQMKNDVQEYTAAFVDPSAIITSFYSSQESVSDSQINVACQVAWSGDIGSGSGEFTLTYNLNNGAWELTNCVVANSNIAPDTTPEIGEVETSIDEDIAETETEDLEVTSEEIDHEVKQKSSVPASSISNIPIGIMTGYSAEEVGTFEDGDGISIYRFKLVNINNDNTAYALATSGQLINQKKYAYIHELIVNNSGKESPFGEYWVVADTEATDENCFGIIDSDGNEVLPCEALSIEMVLGSNRFADICYSTGETTNTQDKYVKKITYSDTNETHYYKGYRKIFDLETKKIIENVETTSSYLDAFSANMTNIIVKDDSTNTIYNLSGEQLIQTSNNVSLGKDYYKIFANGKDCIFDENGIELYSTDCQLSVIDSQSDYLVQRASDGTKIIINKTGTKIIDKPFDFVSEEIHGIFSVCINDTTNQLINLDNEIIYEGPDSIISTHEPGYFYTYSLSSDNERLVGPKGLICDCDGNSSVITLGSRTKDYKYLVLNTGEYSLTLNNSARDLTNAIVAAKDMSGKYSVYELFNGEKLLPGEYSDVQYASGYIYALDGTTWHAFKLKKQYS